MNKKEYLRYGMMVVFRNGERAMYMPSVNGNVFDFCNNRECILLEEFNKDLTHKWNHFYDIAEIYGLAEYPYQTTILNIRNRATIWQRKQYPFLTKYEYELLRRLATEYHQIARDDEEELYAYTRSLIEKGAYGWHYKADGEHDCHYICSLDDDFPFVKWTDAEPWNIQELLDNCEVEK